MKALLQRVTQANVQVDGEVVNAIEGGLLVFLGVEKSDNEENLKRMVERILGYRVFQDSNDQMNLNIQQVQGEILCISQFTLSADTKKGMRPSFSACKDPKVAKDYYHKALDMFNQAGINTKPGIFGANMQISLINDGPVTFLLEA